MRAIALGLFAVCIFVLVACQFNDVPNPTYAACYQDSVCPVGERCGSAALVPNGKYCGTELGVQTHGGWVTPSGDSGTNASGPSEANVSYTCVYLNVGEPMSPNVAVFRYCNAIDAAPDCPGSICAPHQVCGVSADSSALGSHTMCFPESMVFIPCSGNETCKPAANCCYHVVLEANGQSFQEHTAPY